MNVVNLVGRVKSENIELRKTTSGESVTDILLVTEEDYIDKKNGGQRRNREEWHNVVFWGNNAEVAARCLKQGDFVAIEGKVAYRQRQDRNGGKKRVTEIVCRRLELLNGQAFTDEELTKAPF